jgi:AraC-like DNA-binding protein
MTPVNFITLCRIQLAKKWLLEDMDMPIKSIAQLAGYTNVSYFNKKFLEHEGMTPSSFRQRRSR